MISRHWLGTLDLKNSYHHLGSSPMRPNELWIRQHDGAARAQTPGCQHSNWRSVRRGKGGDRYTIASDVAGKGKGWGSMHPRLSEGGGISAIAAKAAKFWKRDISSASERAFPGFFGHFFGCSTPLKKRCFSTEEFTRFLSICARGLGGGANLKKRHANEEE